MSTEEFYELVKKEAVHLRNNATTEEKERLDYYKLEVVNPSKCIYGLITGNCNSDRADELSTKLFDDVGFMDDDNPKTGLSVINDWSHAHNIVLETNYNHFSPIEVYITLQDAKTKELIDFIKGFRKDFQP